MILRGDCDKMEYKEDVQIKKVHWCLKNDCLRYVYINIHIYQYNYMCTYTDVPIVYTHAYVHTYY
jgi:hypothetical protein